MNKSILYILAAFVLMAVVMATPLSIIDSKYITTDTTIGGPVWQITTRGDNDASYTLFGDKTNITGTSGTETVTPANNFRLSQDITSESCEYTLTNTGRNPIEQYSIVKTGTNIFFTAKDKFINDCYNSSNGILAWGESGISLGAFQNIYCLKEDKRANVGSIAEGRINFNAAFNLQKGSETPITQSITTLATNTNQIPTNIVFMNGNTPVARIRWIGGSTFGETCPGQDNYVAIESDKWYTGDLDSYTLYNEQYTLIHELAKTIKTSNSATSLQIANIKTYVAAANTRGTAALAPSSISVDNITATVSGAQATILLPRDHLIYTPDFQILVSANWVGIVYQTSKPKITDAGFNSCNENGSNSFYVTIQNVGTKDSSFDVGATCQAGISISATSRNIALKAGESGTVTIPFSIDLTSDATKSCTIQVSDRGNIAMLDRTSISTSCQASTFCTQAGQKTCFGTTEKICQGGQWIDTGSTTCNTVICNRDTKCDSNKGESFEKCGGKASSNNDCATCNLNKICDATETVYSCPGDCGAPSPATASWIYIIGGILLAGAVFYGLTRIKPKKKHHGRK